MRTKTFKMANQTIQLSQKASLFRKKKEKRAKLCLKSTGNVSQQHREKHHSEILFQVFQIGSNYWMAWATLASATSKPAIGNSILILVFVALSIGCSFGILVRGILGVVAGYKIVAILFKKMHMCFFGGPMSFFDANPSGRILNTTCQYMLIFMIFSGLF